MKKRDLRKGRLKYSGMRIKENFMTTNGTEHPPIHDNQQSLDPVCGMEVDPSAPAATLLHSSLFVQK